MRVFVIGTAASVWTKEYIKNIHLEKEREVYLTSYEALSKEDEEDYSKLGVKIVQLAKTNSKCAKITKLLKLCIFSIKHKYYKKFDYIDIQGPPHSTQALILSNIVKFLNVKTVTTFWGSDILCLNDDDAWKLKKIVKVSDTINLPTPEMLEKFTYHFGERYKPYIAEAKFGSLAFSAIDCVRANCDKGKCKNFFNIDDQKITIAVGYNGRREQQHVLALNALSTISSEVKEKLFLIIHMGYNLENEYYPEVQKAAAACGIDYTIITEQFELDKIAFLRMATDIFLHAQTSDALSGSIRECIYAEVILINPEWIRYSEYDDKGIEYIKYSDFREISTIVEQIVKKDIRIDTERNARIIGNAYSWSEVRKDWENIFDERTS